MFAALTVGIRIAQSRLRHSVLGLEPQERANLYNAFAVGRGDLTKRPTARSGNVCTSRSSTAAKTRVVEMRLIEDVFGLPTNLEAEAFGEPEDSSQAGIKLPKPRSPKPRLRAVNIADAG